MVKKVKKPEPTRVELARHVSVPVLLLMLLTLPWFFGGREPFGHLVTAGLSMLLFLSWLLISRHRALRVDIRPLFIIGPLVVLIVWSGITLLWSVSLFQSTILLTTICETALAFVVARDVLHEDQAQHFFTRLWVIVALVMWAIGIGLFVAGDYDRMTSLFYWANPLATYFLVSLLASLHTYRTSLTKASRGWLLVSGILMSGLLLTYSRAAWVIALIVLGATLWSGRERRMEALRLAKVLCIGLALTVLTIGVRQVAYKHPTIDVQSRISESASSTSVKDRIQYWRESSVLFSERPLTGWGIGTYAEVHPQVQSSPTTAGNNPHNSFLQGLVELGVVGGAAYLVLIGGWLWQGWRILRNTQRSEIALTAWLIVTVIGLHSWLDLISNYPVLIMAGAVWLAVAIASPRYEFRLKKWTTALPIVGAGLLVLAAGIVSWIVYLNSLSGLTINAQQGFDFDGVANTYKDEFSRLIYDPDALSAAAVNYIDQYDAVAVGTNPAGFLDPALAYAQHAVRLEPQDAKHVFALANILERQGKVTEALTNYRQAIGLDPHNNPQYQIAYARLLQREGFVTEAIGTMRTILGEYTPQVIANRSEAPLGQRLAVGHAVLASLYIEKNDVGHAQQSIDEALRLSPSNPFVLQVKSALESAQQ